MTIRKRKTLKSTVLIYKAPGTLQSSIKQKKINKTRIDKNTMANNSILIIFISCKSTN